MATAYPKLFQPLALKHQTLRNRLVMGSMHVGFEEDRDGFRRLSAFYEERARGGAGLIITGGFSPNFEGRLTPFAAQLSWPWQLAKHRRLTRTVHAAGGSAEAEGKRAEPEGKGAEARGGAPGEAPMPARICLQLLHAGRYAYHPFSVAPTKLKAPITPFRPRALGRFGLWKTVRDFAASAKLAQAAGYDGVEIMGSEGYFLNQFWSAKTNKRTDGYGSGAKGGALEGRMRLPLEVVRAVRAACGPEFLVVYRIPLLDLVDGGSSWEETAAFARALVAAGVDILNSGIGWHESRIPTIATMVPRAAFVDVTARLRKEVGEPLGVPVVAVNRMNTPEVAEGVLASGAADLVSLARPWLADPDFGAKARAGRAEEINTCIACNQACLDHIFLGKPASCLVNPRAGHELEWPVEPAARAKRVAVVGAGPAGMSAALTAARRGHRVTLFEAGAEIGGQFRLARAIPGKEEFAETLRYFEVGFRKYGVDVRLRTRATAEMLGPRRDSGSATEGFDEVILSSGVVPRAVDVFEAARAAGDKRVVHYPELLRGDVAPGERVAVVGAGGIGIDVCAFLLSPRDGSLSLDRAKFFRHWGVDARGDRAGGLQAPEHLFSGRKIYLLQRTKGKLGPRLGKTTGWIHRIELKDGAVRFLNGIAYRRMVPEGLEIERDGTVEILAVDQVVVCAGQESVRDLEAELARVRGDAGSGSGVHVIGGAKLAAELDAKRAIEDGFTLARKL